MKSEVERTFEQLQQKLGGDVAWGELHPMHQQAFIQAVNTILSTCGVKRSDIQ